MMELPNSRWVPCSPWLPYNAPPKGLRWDFWAWWLILIITWLAWGTSRRSLKHFCAGRRGVASGTVSGSWPFPLWHASLCYHYCLPQSVLHSFAMPFRHDGSVSQLANMDQNPDITANLRVCVGILICQWGSWLTLLTSGSWLLSEAPQAAMGLHGSHVTIPAYSLLHVLHTLFLCRSQPGGRMRNGDATTWGSFNWPGSPSDLVKQSLLLRPWVRNWTGTLVV